jgi:hypothetical protein
MDTIHTDTVGIPSQLRSSASRWNLALAKAPARSCPLLGFYMSLVRRSRRTCARTPIVRCVLSIVFHSARSIFLRLTRPALLAREIQLVSTSVKERHMHALYICYAHAHIRVTESGQTASVRIRQAWDNSKDFFIH